MVNSKSERSRVEINLDHFEHNLAELKRLLLPGQQFLQIVKADAYGHGAFEIAKAAIKQGAVYLGVANVEEARLLRLQGIECPILILSPSLPSEIPLIILNGITCSVSDLEFARELNKQAGAENTIQKIHVKLDTGMHRSGIRIEDFPEIWKKLLRMKHLEIEGIFSHYSDSESDQEYTELQTEAFYTSISALSSLPRYIHLANSAALISANTFAANLVRIGIMSYGVYTAAYQYQKLFLKSVMTFISSLAQVKSIRQGESIGYNQTWLAPKTGKYGIIPVGYADGYDYLLGNKGIVSVKGQISRVIGKISMDMITIDLSSLPKIKSGAEVILMGGGANLLRAEQLAAKYQGSAYELLCQIGRRAKRYYFQDGRLISSAPLARREFVSSDYSDTKLSSIISTAISQRLQNDEIAELIFSEVLRGLFYNKDNDIHYRRNFVHSIEFSETAANTEYFLAKTNLSFTKKLQNDYFLVACANSEKVLNRYFLRKDVEYRWLVDTNFALDTHQFAVTNVLINGIKLDTKPIHERGCLEIRCSHPELTALVGTEVDFTIETQTWYPKSSHQVSIFISELTRGVSVSFYFPPALAPVETVTVFSGQNKYPLISKSEGNNVTVETADDEWVFPNSGIVFAY